MAAVGREQSLWRNFLSKNVHCPPAFDRQNKAFEVSSPFAVSLKALDGIENKNGESTTEYQVYVSLYDVAYKQFFGRQWLGPGMGARSSVGQKPRLQYNQTVYFHTSIKDVNIVMVIELVASITDGQGHTKMQSCGWGLLRVFKYEGEMPDTSKPGAPPIHKIELYHGSPRALYFLEEPIESSQYLKPSGCQLTYSIQTHRALLKAVHLLPENVIVGGNDTIPGIISGQIDPNNPNSDFLRKPRLLKSMPCQLDRLAIALPPNIDKFEEELCQFLTEDKNSRERRTADGSTVTILERRLHVGVHNGWSYVDKPQTIHLVVENSSGGGSARKVGMSPTMRRTTKFKHQHTPSGGSSTSSVSVCTHLVARNSVQINDLIEDPMFSLVFSLEYVIGEPLHKDDVKLTSNLVRSHTRNVTIRWAAWNPFLEFLSPDVYINLVGGPGVMPDDTLVYRVPSTDMQDQALAKVAPGSISFYWSDLRKGDHLLLPHGTSTHLSSYDDGSEHMLDISHGKPPIPVNKGSVYDGSRRPSHAVHNGSIGDLSNISEHAAAMMSPRSHTIGAQHDLIVPQMAGAAHATPRGYMGHPGTTPRLNGYPGISHAGGYHPSMGHGMGYPGLGYSAGHPAMYQSGQFAYPVEIGHVREPRSNQSGVTDLNELPFTPVHAPVIITAPSSTSGHGLSRAAYARLYSVGYPPIVDRRGEPPEVVDPHAHFIVDLMKEEMDPLCCNEITFQFLAFSKMLSYETTGPASQSGTVFFTFNFYRYPQLTTERLLLSKPQTEMTNDPHSMPFVLQRLDKDGSLLKGAPGYQLRYFVDPGYLKPGERSLFLKHLSQQTLHIDVWDGDSLLLIGSASVELKCLLRHNLEAVQTTFELDVISMEYEDDMGSNMTGDLHRGGSVRPIGVNTLVKGRLHLRMANVGHLPDMKPSKLAPLNGSVLISETAGKSTYFGGSLIAGTGPDLNKGKKSKAQNLVENNREVASLVLSQKNRSLAGESNREGDAEKTRKLSRMKAVRMSEVEKEDQPLTILGVKQEKAERIRDLKTIDFYRQQTKHDGILSMLSQNMTTEHTIYPSFGMTDFFEFVLRNPFNVEHTVVVECNDPELRVVTDSREWRHFKQVHQVPTPVEEGMFSKPGVNAELPQLFLRPKETVNIPFKFAMFAADHSVKPQGPLDPYNKERNEKNKSGFGEKINSLSRLIKVYFKSEDNKPLAVLNLKVEPQPHIIDQTFRFHHPEQAFLKKSIRLPPFHSLPGAPVGGTDSQKLFVRCSDPNVICESKKTQAGEPQDVFLKVACGPSPQIKKFFIAIYTDFYLTRPAQLWQFYVHSLQRVDVSCVEGQVNKFSLILRGTQSSRLVRCYSSHPNEMFLQPSEPFLLAASTVHELTVDVRPLRVGNKFFYLNVIDTEYHQLLRTWLVCVNCRPPMISRAFELNLPIGGGKGSNKRITFNNPYPHKKAFLLRSNRDDLLQFKDTRLEIDGGCTQSIGLRFAPCMRPDSTEILIFINDEEDKNEETFCIKATYSIE